jgi:hypothetical protein
MRLAIASVQKNRARYIAEWIAFHQVIGIEDFIIYSHDCNDDQHNLIKMLSKVDTKIVQYIVNGTSNRIQMDIYQHCINNYKNRYDAIAFLDGDEFLFSPSGDTVNVISNALNMRYSALAVYWLIHGSSGHIKEPEGLVINRFRRHSNPNFRINRLFKSIVIPAEVLKIKNPHYFETVKGTVDETGRLITGVTQEEKVSVASHSSIRINHYVTQSWEYFKQSKQTIGYIDRKPTKLNIRQDEWFHLHDRNEESDGKILNYVIRTAVRRDELLKAAKYSKA